MVNMNSSLGHDLFKVAARDCVANVEEDRVQDHGFRKLRALEINHHEALCQLSRATP
jgi:hypothetical protein